MSVRGTQHELSPPQDCFTCIELFAGCGGMALGLHWAGWKGLFAIEKDPMAFETLAVNMIHQGASYSTYAEWPHWLETTNHDLTGLLADNETRKRLEALQGTVDLVAGGPPCQGFSIGGRRDGADERNSLVYHMLDFIDLVRPKVALIENVEGITRRFVSKPNTFKATVADEVAERLQAMGYAAGFRIVNANDFGVPQSRRRVAIFAVRMDLAKKGPHISDLMDTILPRAASSVRNKYGLPEDRDVTAREAIDDLANKKRVICPDSPKFDSTTYKRSSSRYQKLMRRGLRTGEIPDSHRFSKHGPRITELYELAHRTQKPGRLSKQFLLENNTKKDKKVLIDPCDLVATITTHPDEYIHYDEPRNITVREMCRLQSIPDDFVIRGRYTINGPRRKYDVARCSQVGNAVPPLMAEGLGIAVKTMLQTYHGSREDGLDGPKAEKRGVAAA